MTRTACKTTNTVDQDVQIDEDLAEVGTGVILAASTLVGLWGTACMASALFQFGVTGVMKGYISSLAG